MDIYDKENNFNSVRALKNNYSDLDFSLKQHPGYSDILPIKGVEAIKRSIRNLVILSKYDRVFQPNLTSAVEDFIFSKSNTINRALIIQEIKRVLSLHEPRIADVRVGITTFEQEYIISIFFVIVNINIEESVDVVVQRNR